MSERSSVIARKALSLALIFNSVLSLISAANLLTKFYLSNCEWRPYSPYLIDGSFLWAVVLAAILNIVPAKLVGRVNMKRFLFHHYVYGFMASSVSLLWLMVFHKPAHLLLLVMPSVGFAGGLQTIPVYAGLFFVYGGVTLVIDDIHDVSLRMGRMLDKLKKAALKSGSLLQAVHLCSSLISIYILTCIFLWFLENGLMAESWSLWHMSHIVFMSNLLVMSLLGLKAVKGGSWSVKAFTNLSEEEFSVRGN
jgi:hypothetical protein